MVMLRIAALVAALSATHAMAEETLRNRVGIYGTWSVVQEQNPTECIVVSGRADQSSARDRRAFLYVFFKPTEGAAGQVTFTGGHPYAPGSTVTLDVDGTEFTLFTEGEWAWSHGPEDDARIIEALRAGRVATFTGRSSQGPVRDEFSLVRFDAALDDARSRCAS